MKAEANVIICRYRDSSRVRLDRADVFRCGSLLYGGRGKGPPLRFALLSHCLNNFLHIYVIFVLFITLLNNIIGDTRTIIYKTLHNESSIISLKQCFKLIKYYRAKSVFIST